MPSNILAAIVNATGPLRKRMESAITFSQALYASFEDTQGVMAFSMQGIQKV
jgi:hypothetical protein